MVLCLLVLNVLNLFSSSVSTSGERYINGDNTNIDEALRFLEQHNEKLIAMQKKVSLASWGYDSNLTEENKNLMLKALDEGAAFSNEQWKKAISYDWKQFKNKNDTIYRWFKKLAILGDAALPDAKFKELQKTIADMKDIYANAKVCNLNAKANNSCNSALEPDITKLLKTSRDYDELKHLWKQWRDVSGKKMRGKFSRYVRLSNEATRLNGFADTGEFWRDAYETDTLEADIKKLWKTLRPFYQQLHAYVRRRLIQFYNRSEITPDGPIPAHLFGNMWSQTWYNIFPLVRPYPEKNTEDVSKNMRKKNLKPYDMFKIAEEFFTSCGLHEMTPEFWNRSIIEKPKDREMICHASAWNFADGKDVRIKMCTEVDKEDLITVHHEMGHIEYFLEYSKQPAVFREAANPGFHEAIGDTLAFSVSTPGHMKRIGLLTSVTNSKEDEINRLMEMALFKVAFLPFGYLIDSWRWKVFKGDIAFSEYNSKWWELRLKYQGICPPVKRTRGDLDPAGKYHVIADVPYVRYFVSFIIQFQFHKSLCNAAGYKGPLHKCDIYRSKRAGELLRSMLRLGTSVSWNEAMSTITEGKTNQIDVTPLLEYFDPLIKWLKKQNKNEYIGWKSKDPMVCP